jgi:hypothetical protein
MRILHLRYSHSQAVKLTSIEKKDPTSTKNAMIASATYAEGNARRCHTASNKNNKRVQPGA